MAVLRCRRHPQPSSSAAADPESKGAALLDLESKTVYFYFKRTRSTTDRLRRNRHFCARRSRQSPDPLSSWTLDLNTVSFAPFVFILW